ncbi:hypothetical protein WJX77_001964 [Trebouxia sp. C0004]
MMLASLPAPTREYAAPQAPVSASTALVSQTRKEPPPYGSQERARYVPRRQEDFGDGGAFPEVQVAQFPLDMGKKGQQSGVGSSSGRDTTLAVTMNADGEVNYDSILRQGRNKDKIIYSDHKSLVPKVDALREGNFEKPDEEEIEQTMKDTAAALNLVVSNKLQAAQPKTVPKQPGAPTFIKYTPSQQGPQYASGARERTIKMQDMPVDPMEPPKFRHKKVPRGAGSPPVPIMHSPPRPVSVKDQQDWKIPPSISNWKNPKGYTIPLDKRLAADGRGLQETAINDSFAKFTEALYMAESSARQAIETRNRVARELQAREKEKKEVELRDLAMRARMERGGGGSYVPPPAAARGTGVAVGGLDSDLGAREEYPPPPARGGGELPGPPSRGPPGERETAEERAERRRRDEIRGERKRERERERRLDAKDAHGVKKSKLTRDRDRDISEKIALGQANVGATGQPMYDQRLFNQDTGVASGLGADDTYNVYDKALFADKGSGLYKPNKQVDDDDVPVDADKDGRKFKPDQGFSGVDYGAASRRDTGPVQFEREAVDADIFGLDKFANDVRGGSRKKNALDSIGGGGAMRAGGGGGKYEDYAGGSSRSNVQFERSRH